MVIMCSSRPRAARAAELRCPVAGCGLNSTVIGAADANSARTIASPIVATEE